METSLSPSKHQIAQATSCLRLLPRHGPYTAHHAGHTGPRVTRNTHDVVELGVLVRVADDGRCAVLQREVGRYVGEGAAVVERHVDAARVAGPHRHVSREADDQLRAAAGPVDQARVVGVVQFHLVATGAGQVIDAWCRQNVGSRWITCINKIVKSQIQCRTTDIHKHQTMKDYKSGMSYHQQCMSFLLQFFITGRIDNPMTNADV